MRCTHDACLGFPHLVLLFTHDSVNAIAPRVLCYRPSCRAVCLSVCHTGTRISRKRLNLGSCTFHHTVVPSLYLLRDKFHPEILTGFPRAGASNKSQAGETNYFLAYASISLESDKRDMTKVNQKPQPTRQQCVYEDPCGRI